VSKLILQSGFNKGFILTQHQQSKSRMSCILQSDEKLIIMYFLFDWGTKSVISKPITDTQAINPK